MESTPDTPSYMIGLHENKVVRVPLVDAVSMTRSVAAAVKDKDFDRALDLRGTEFKEALDGFITTASVVDEAAMLPKEQVRYHYLLPESLSEAVVRGCVLV